MTAINRIVVIDTSYLLEIFRVDGFCDESDSKIIIKKFDEALDAGHYDFYVPVPVLFEFADHIADVKNHTNRRNLARKLHEVIHSCLEGGRPWTLTPPGASKSIEELLNALLFMMREFSNNFSTQKLGLTDTVVALEAKRLREKYNDKNRYAVHIWTRHTALKSHEPDAEPDPFV